MKQRYTSKHLMLLQDLALSVLASLLSMLLVRWIGEPFPGFSGMVLHWLVYSAAVSAVGFLLSGVPRVVRRYVSFSVVVRLLCAIALKESLLAVVVAVGWVAIPERLLAVALIATDTLLTAVGLFYPRLVSAVSRRDDAALRTLSHRRSALVMGTGASSVALSEDAERTGHYMVIGFLSPDPEMSGRVIRDKSVYVFASPADIETLQWRLGGIDCILFPKDSDRRDPQVHLPEHVVQMDPMGRVEHFVKRAFDILLSGALLIVFSPLILICAIAIKLEDGDPVIYSQERIGRGGKPFNILKFRSMRKDAESCGPALYAGDEDPRLTRVGKFLRQHHLDELPQLWNVFVGDMSFIGYRPERQYYIDQIMARNPRYRYLYQIRPGVTSYATLYNGYTDTLDKMLTRLDLDLYYLRNHSVWFDAKVLGLTFLSIVSGRKF